MEEMIDFMMALDAVGCKLEITDGLTTWEPYPFLKHQRAVDRIRKSIKTFGEQTLSCVEYRDVMVQFPDGSLKRPDISIFCREPDEETTPVTLMPEAVVEVVSRGYEKKDWEVSAPFYRRIGVRDVVVYDPDTNEVTHWQQGQTEQTHPSPITITLLCGCTCVV